MRVALVMRQPTDDQVSIERVITTLLPNLPPDIDWELVRVPAVRGVLGRIRNILTTANIRADVVHITGDIYYCALGVRHASCVTTFHDLVSLHRLTGLRRQVFSYLWYYLPVRLSDSVVAISGTIAAELEEAFGPVERPIQIVHNPVSSIFEPGPSIYDRSGPFRLLQIGTRTNKNLDRVIEACLQLPVQLRVVGHLKADQKTLALGADLVELGTLEDQELVTEYQSCDALVFASTYEGFGLPVLEAQACGLPVICADTPVGREVAGDGAIFVDPWRVEAIRDGIATVMNSAEVRSSLQASGFRNLEQFSPARTAEKYASIYRAVFQAH